MALSESMMLSDDDLQKIYLWIDSIPLSRPKRNIARDFSDGVLMAEVVAHYFPKYVELHNYSAANSLRQKLYNWSTLNQKVFKRLDGFEVKKADVDAAVSCKPGAIELILFALQQKITELRARKAAGGSDYGSSSPSDADVPSGSARGFAPSSSSSSAVPSASSSLGGVARALQMSSAAGGVAAPVAAAAVGGGLGSARMMAPAAAAMSSSASSSSSAIDAAVLAEKEHTIAELRETLEIQELKIRKLEQLVKLKDQRIQTLTARLTQAAAAAPPGPQ